jgi:hypothetical protein
LPLPLLFATALSAAQAADVQFEGFYRARGRAFETLSLDRENAANEGLAMYGDHRLWLAPRLLLSDAVGLQLEFRGLDGVNWGAEPEPYVAFVPRSPFVLEQGLGAPTSGTDEETPLLDFTLWRVYGDVDTKIGRFSFGRMPLHWGQGLWLNDGTSLDREFVDHGDTSDRVQWEYLVEEQVFVRAGVDVPAERFVGQGDDTLAVDLAAAYRTEDLRAGLLARLDHTGPLSEDADSLNVVTLDISGEATLGRIHAGAEIVGQFGGGDQEELGLNDATITAFGGVLDADLTLDAFTARVQVGGATGDGTVNDASIKTFTFDRDYSVGMFLFEQPMPVLATPGAAANESNGGRDYSSTLTGNTLSNALFVKPTISRAIVDGLTVSGSWLGARTAKAPELNGENQSRGYGNEFQLGLRYDRVEHFALDFRAGAFLPGSVYSVGDNGVDLTGFDDTVFGAQLGGRIEF